MIALIRIIYRLARKRSVFPRFWTLGLAFLLVPLILLTTERIRFYDRDDVRVISIMIFGVSHILLYLQAALSTARVAQAGADLLTSWGACLPPRRDHLYYAHNVSVWFDLLLRLSPLFLLTLLLPSHSSPRYSSLHYSIFPYITTLYFIFILPTFLITAAMLNRVPIPWWTGPLRLLGFVLSGFLFLFTPLFVETPSQLPATGALYLTLCFVLGRFAQKRYSLSPPPQALATKTDPGADAPCIVRKVHDFNLRVHIAQWLQEKGVSTARTLPLLIKMPPNMQSLYSSGLFLMAAFASLAIPLTWRGLALHTITYPSLAFGVIVFLFISAFGSPFPLPLTGLYCMVPRHRLFAYMMGVRIPLFLLFSLGLFITTGPREGLIRTALVLFCASFQLWFIIPLTPSRHASYHISRLIKTALLSICFFIAIPFMLSDYLPVIGKLHHAFTRLGPSRFAATAWQQEPSLFLGLLAFLTSMILLREAQRNFAHMETVPSTQRRPKGLAASSG